jgi:hydroxymethylglutaryl-CoA lyase
MALPATVTIVEVGPRDGLQNEAAEIPTEVKRGFIDRLGAAGLRVIEATSFVHPRSVPQLADADVLFPSLDRRPGVRYPVLVPTLRGLERAVAAGADEVAVVIGATDAFNRANLNRTTDEALADAADVVAGARARSMPVRGYVSVAFGCPYEGAVPPAATARVAGRLLDLGCHEISLGDTIGAATPGDVDRVLDAVLPLVDVARVGLHAHDTRGQALANVYAALERGVTVVDSSAGGLGGCPFAGPGAVGNLATEDLVYLLDGLGIEHGASLEGVMAASAFIQSAVGHPLRSPTWLAGGRPVPRPLPDGAGPAASGTGGERAV